LDIKTLLRRAINGTKYLENFVTTAQKQFQHQDIQKTFSLNLETKQIMNMLNYKANKLHVKIILEAKETIKTFGNPIKFNQVMTNLILNAIDSYEGIKKKNSK